MVGVRWRVDIAIRESFLLLLRNPHPLDDGVVMFFGVVKLDAFGCLGGIKIRAVGMRQRGSLFWSFERVYSLVLP